MENLTFTVDSALLSELGEKLVESVHIALVELIKNSYDADATEVIITFFEEKKGGPNIQIIDNGVGMTLEEVKRYWMRIATTNKVNNNYSKLFGRPKTGAKGIGRFSCRRLGTYLNLSTIAEYKEYKYQKTDVEFFWNKFSAGKDVTEIECPGNSTNVLNETTGTILSISGSPTDEWSKRGYDFLKRQLSTLVANQGTKRKGFKEDPGFNVKLIAPKYEDDQIIDLRTKLINSGWGTLTAFINKDGKADCNLSAKGLGNENKITSQKTFRHLKGVKLQLGIMVDKGREWLRDTEVMSLGTMNKILEDWGGVQVKFNNFRVYPYGDDDWLDIDKERGLRKGPIKNDQLIDFTKSLKKVDPERAMLSMLSMKNYIGNVEIFFNASEIQMKTNREGFIENEAFKELREFVRFAIDWSTILRDYYIRLNLNAEAEESKRILEEKLGEDIDDDKVIESAVNYIQKEVKSLSTFLPLRERLQVEKTVFSATEAILKHDKSNKEELNHLRLISSTSTLLLLFSHEVKSLLGLIEENYNAIRNLKIELKGKDLKTIKDINEDLLDTKDRLIDLMDLTSIISVEGRTLKRDDLALKQRVEKAIKCYSLIISQYNIDIDISKIPNNVLIGPISEAELYSILLNVISNSIKSVVAAGRNKIELSATKQQHKSILVIKDNGIGLSDDLFEQVFIPFISDPAGNLYSNLYKNLNPQDNYIVGTGSGLGLSIIKEIIESCNGKIYFKKPEDNWKSELIITI